MGNKAAAYRSDEVRQAVQEWFDLSTGYMASPQREEGLGVLFLEYTRWLLDKDDARIGAVVDYEAFGRTLYALGVDNIGTDGITLYKQLPTWRPSLDQVRRFKVAA